MAYRAEPETEMDLLAELELEVGDLCRQIAAQENISQPEGEWAPQPVLCPTPTPYIVSGFPRYRYSGTSLAAPEQQKLRYVAEDILASYRPGCIPIATVHLVGHADRDLQRGREFENHISRQRALGVRDTLLNLINYPLIAAQIRWTVCSMGSYQLVVLKPRNEAERSLNRRVEIHLSTDVSPYPVHTTATGAAVPLAGCSPPPNVCHQLSVTVHSTDHGDYTANLFVREPDQWRYMDSYSGVDIAGRYENGHGRGSWPTGTLFVDAHGNIVLFVADFLPFNQNKYPPKGAFSRGTGKFVTPPSRLKLATPNIQWEVLELKDC